MKGLIKKFDAYTPLFKEGDASNELYFILSGRVLVCTIHGTQVKALGRVGQGEFIGELSFFDNNPRASHVITIEPSEIVIFKRNEIFPHLPLWHKEIHKILTKKIRILDKIVHDNSIRRASTEEQAPLSVEEQRKIFSIFNH